MFFTVTVKGNLVVFCLRPSPEEKRGRNVLRVIFHYGPVIDVCVFWDVPAVLEQGGLLYK